MIGVVELNGRNRPRIKWNNFPENKLPDISSEVKMPQPIVNLESTRQKKMKELSDTFDHQHKIKLEKELNQITREEKQIELLEEIKNNTGSLVNMVDMIRFNSDQQTEIMLVIADILTIGTATTPEEAESLYKKTMDKINHTIESGENIAKLTTWATAAWNLMDKLPL